jgi:hypothetical protein
MSVVPGVLGGLGRGGESRHRARTETFDVTHECGSGGCQQSVGDFLYHCHIAEHYFAGMWGLWRVYDTLQDGLSSTDALPPLLPLPDRGGPAPLVDLAPDRPGGEAEAGRRFDLDLVLLGGRGRGCHEDEGEGR